MRRADLQRKVPFHRARKVVPKGSAPVYLIRDDFNNERYIACSINPKGMDWLLTLPCFAVPHSTGSSKIKKLFSPDYQRVLPSRSGDLVKIGNSHLKPVDCA
jgi:hypothetical protein